MTPDCRTPTGPALWAPPLLFLGLLAIVLLSDADRALFLRLNAWGGGHHDWAGITLLGEPLVVLALGLVCYLRRPQAGWSLILAGLLAALLVNVLKSAFGLPRPAAVLPPESFHLLGETLRWRAMPSGHTTTAFLFAAVVFWCADIRAMRVVALVLAALAGLSRIMVGAHWPSDVLAGAALGWLMGAFGVWLSARLPQLYRPTALRLGGAILATAAAALLIHRSGYPEAHTLQQALGALILATAAVVLWRRRRRQA